MKQGKPEQYKKVRFYSQVYGPTVGIVLTIAKLTELGLDGFSRLFPYSESLKMDRIQLSPPYDTWEEAFNHEFN